MKYRKKPVVIEAVQFAGWFDGCLGVTSSEQVPGWLHEATTKGQEVGAIWSAGGKAAIRTLEGVIYADVNDWIIRGVKGELYPCKPDIFEATYEKVY